MARDNGYKDDQTDALLAAILRVPRRKCRRAVVYWHVIHTIITAALVVAVVVLAVDRAAWVRLAKQQDDTINAIKAVVYELRQALQDE